MNTSLTQFGLDESESLVYAALLELGTASVSDITSKAQITRTLGYHVLGKLVKKGLVDEVLSSKKKTYKVRHPQFLKRYVDKQKQKWKVRSETLDALLPEYISAYAVDNKPVVRYREGVAGVKELFEEKLHSKSEILSILDIESWKTPNFWDWANEYHNMRIRKKISERILLLDTPEGRKWISEYKGPKRFTTYRWVTKEYAKKLLQYGGAVDIYEDKVMVSLLDIPQKGGMIIEGGILANILRAMFELAWEHAEEIDFPG